MLRIWINSTTNKKLFSRQRNHNCQRLSIWFTNSKFSEDIDYLYQSCYFFYSYLNVMSERVCERNVYLIASNSKAFKTIISFFYKCFFCKHTLTLKYFIILEEFTPSFHQCVSPNQTIESMLSFFNSGIAALESWRALSINQI